MAERSKRKLSNIEDIKDPVVKSMGIVREALDSISYDINNITILPSDVRKNIGKNIRYLLNEARMPLAEIAELIGVGKDNVDVVVELSNLGTKKEEKTQPIQELYKDKDQEINIDEQEILEKLSEITHETLMKSAKEKQYYAMYIGAKLMERDGYRINTIQDLNEYLNFILSSTEREVVAENEVYRTAVLTTTKIAELYLKEILDLEKILYGAIATIEKMKERMKDLSKEIEDEIEEDEKRESSKKKGKMKIDIIKEIQEANTKRGQTENHSEEVFSQPDLEDQFDEIVESEEIINELEKIEGDDGDQNEETEGKEVD